MRLQRVSPAKIAIFVNHAMERKRPELFPQISPLNTCYVGELSLSQGHEEKTYSIVCGYNPAYGSLETVLLKCGLTEVVVSMDNNGDPKCAKLKYCLNERSPQFPFEPARFMIARAKVAGRKLDNIEYLQYTGGENGACSWVDISKSNGPGIASLRSSFALYVITASVASKSTLPQIRQMEFSVN